MSRLRILILLLFTGCAPVLDAQLRLIDVSRKGLADVKQSLDQRQTLIASLQAAQRSQLDAAFDQDVNDQPSLSPAWVIESRTAYAAAIEQFNQQRIASAAAADADRANLAAIDSALRQLEALSQAQLKLNLLPEH
ncbi:MAG: hypothetical protein JWM57_2040 [Phycisphaerales bacterium]|nr:hypothetical protein [Phycisphaerales bacterium]